MNHSGTKGLNSHFGEFCDSLKTIGTVLIWLPILLFSLCNTPSFTFLFRLGWCGSYLLSHLLTLVASGAVAAFCFFSAEGKENKKIFNSRKNPNYLWQTPLNEQYLQLSRLVVCLKGIDWSNNSVSFSFSFCSNRTLKSFKFSSLNAKPLIPISENWVSFFKSLTV